MRNEISNLKNQLSNTQYENEKLSEEYEHRINIMSISEQDKTRKFENKIDDLELKIKILKGKFIE